jgi:hypothetical protein
MVTPNAEITAARSAAVWRAKDAVRVMQTVMSLHIQRALVSADPQSMDDLDAVLKQLKSAMLDLSLARMRAKEGGA